MFLMGPLNQLKKMFDPSRLVATIVFLVKIDFKFIEAIDRNI